MASEANHIRLRQVPEHVVIDVTLRDGGFRTEFAWRISTARIVIEGAFAAGANYCELGYIGGVPEMHSTKSSAPFAALNLKTIEALIGDTPSGGGKGRRFSVMRHPTGNRARPPFDELASTGVDLVRFVFHPSWTNELSAEHEYAKAAGLKTAVNIALASKYSQPELNHLIRTAEKLDPDVIYFADTCGALLPNELSELIRSVQPGRSVGFHGHDYLSLAIANSLAALEAGAEWIDTSVWGLGRGAGNARSEIWAALRQQSNALNIHPLELSRSMLRLKRELGAPALPDWVAVVCGAANLSPPEEDQLRRSADPDLEASKLLARFSSVSLPQS